MLPHSSPLNLPPYRLTHFAGDWAGECNMSEVELTEGIKVIDSKLGTRATFFAHPMCLLSLNGRMTEDNGEVIGMALAWPANFKLEFEKTTIRNSVYLPE